MRHLLLLIIFSCVVQAQQKVILDSLTNEPIPHVSVFDGKKGVIANTAGTFYWDKTKTDSITLSCLGYAQKRVATTQIKDTLFMLPETVELMPVVVSNRTLTANEIIDSVKVHTKRNIDFGLSVSEVFVHRKNSYNNQKIVVEIKKSTIPELDQRFVDEILTEIPENEFNESFSKSTWLRDSDGLTHHKLTILKAANLKDSLMDSHFDSVEKTIDEVMQKRIKKDSYFKVKSGPLITVSMDNPVGEIDSIEQKKKIVTPKKYAERELGNLQRLANKNLFENKHWALPFLATPNRYEYTYEGVVYDFNRPAYKLQFSSTKKKDYSGYLMVDVEDFGVHKIVYYSNKHLRRIKLFGLFFEKRLNNIAYTFVKNHRGKYTLYHIYEEHELKNGVKRPFKIIEKNKVVKGRNRQNTLSMDVNFSMRQIQQQHVYIHSYTPISKKEFDTFKLNHKALPKDLYSKAAVIKYIPGLPVE